MGVRRSTVSLTIFIAALAVACGQAGTTGSPAADLDEVLVDRGYGKHLMAMNIRTCATRELPIIGREPVAFTRDHKMVATLRRINPVSALALPSRLTVGPASADERQAVWTVGDEAYAGIAFDPSGGLIALALQRTMDRGSNISADAVDDGLWTVTTSGDRRRQLVAGYPQRFAWSPDGTNIASTTLEPSQARSSKVWVVDVKTGGRRIIATLEQPASATGVMDWSPDGQNILLFTGPSDPSRGTTLTNLEQVRASDGRRAAILGPVAGDYYQRAVYAADGRTVIAQRLRVPKNPPGPPGGPNVTVRADALDPRAADPRAADPRAADPRTADPRTADLVSVRIDGTDFQSLCPLNPADTLLDWH